MNYLKIQIIKYQLLNFLTVIRQMKKHKSKLVPSLGTGVKFPKVFLKVQFQTTNVFIIATFYLYRERNFYNYADDNTLSFHTPNFESLSDDSITKQKLHSDKPVSGKLYAGKSRRVRSCYRWLQTHILFSFKIGDSIIN